MSENDELEQLRNLLDKGILTQEEFEEKKQLLEHQQNEEPKLSCDSVNKFDTVSSNDSSSTADTSKKSDLQNSEEAVPQNKDSSTPEQSQTTAQDQSLQPLENPNVSKRIIQREKKKGGGTSKKILIFFLKWIGIYLGIFIATSIVSLFCSASMKGQSLYYSMVHSLAMTWLIDILAFIPFIIVLIVVVIRRLHKSKNLTDDDMNNETISKPKKFTLKVSLTLLILQILFLVIFFIFPIHSWAAATCTAPKTCTICEMTEGEAEGHAWESATCTEPRQCSRCGQTFGFALGHDIGNVICTESGVCKRCGEEVHATGHKWKEATCTTPKTCSVCGTTEGNALGHTTANGTCTRCGELIFETVSGSGDDVIEGLQLSTGMYRVHFTNSGSSNFVVWVDGTSSSRDLKINDIGAYDGYIFLVGGDTYKLEIESSGSWSYTVEQLQTTTNTSFSGTGDYVTDKITCSSGTWHFSHNGSSNFVIRAYTTNGGDLLVNTIGAYDGKKSVTIPQESNVLFEINADGDWSAEKQ